MKIVFFGSDDFAVTHLEALIKSGHQVLCCVTQPDKPKGRDLKVAVSPIKDCAQKHKLPVLQPAKLKDFEIILQLKNFQADLFIVVAYGKILPTEVLSLPKIFCVNVHGSLLPKYRGAAPINWAIINGETMTGVTIIKLSPVMDAGEIISQRKITIERNDTAITLRKEMAKLGADLLLETLTNIEKGSFSLNAQDEQLVSFAPKLTKEHGLIPWEKNADDIARLVRGLIPWPAAYSRFGAKILKVLEALVTDVSTGKFSSGQVIDISKDGFIVATGRGG